MSSYIDFWAEVESDIRYIAAYGEDDMVTGTSVYAPSLRLKFPCGSLCRQLMAHCFDMNALFDELVPDRVVKQPIDLARLLRAHLHARNVPRENVALVTHVIMLHIEQQLKLRM